MIGFYNPCLTLRMKTKRGGYPLVTYVVSHIRGPGKTYGWTELLTDYVFDNPTIKGFEDEERKLFEEYFAEGGKFVLLTRKRGTLGHVFAGVFKKMLMDVYPDVVRFYEQEGVKGVYSNCYMETINSDGECVKHHVGYVIALAASDDVKIVSSMFSDAGVIFCDEFQPANKETYLTDEYQKFETIYDSIARGGDDDAKGLRKVPVVFCSNTISIVNPYFVKCGLWKKIQKNTMKYIGDNFVFHRVERQDIQDKREEQGLRSVFTEDNDDNVWLNDDDSCIVSNMSGCGQPQYDCTLVSGSQKYGVKWYPEVGLYYVDMKPDNTDPMVFNLFTADMKPNIPAFKSSMRMIRLRKAMLGGTCRFANGMIKNDCMNILLGAMK